MTRTPSVGAESMTTPAAPRPRASSIWVRAPPKEWPMMIGGFSTDVTTETRWSMVAVMSASAIGWGSARSASTSTSKPG